MENKPVNRKVTYTRKVIKDSFLELLKDKSFDKITVKEITEMADINRATFYAHYENSQALTEEIEKEMAQQVINAMADLYHSDQYEKNIVSALFDAMVQKKEMCMWMLDDRVTGCGSRMIYSYAKEICVPRWKEVGHLTDEQAEQFLTFIYNGALGFLKRWYENGFSGSIDEYKLQFEQMIHCTLQYIYKEVKS